MCWLIQLPWEEACNSVTVAAACFCISRFIGRFSVYSCRAVTGVVFIALHVILRALFWAVPGCLRFALLFVSIPLL